MEGLINRSERGQPRIFERIAALNDPIRCRILLVLESQTLTVSELRNVLQLPQSTVSRHLKILADDGWVVARREGTSRRYSALREITDAATSRLWQLLRDEVATGSAAVQDRTRLAGVLAERRTKSQEFFSTAAGQWAEMRHELFGGRFDLEGLLGLLDEDWTLGDLGCGTGQTTQSLAPFVKQVIAVDESDAMLAAARQRLEKAGKVELRYGRLEDLPIATDSLDVATMVLVLHHLANPPKTLVEAARALKPGGKLLIVDMLPHDREEYRQDMGHVWLGFSTTQLSEWLAEAGFERLHFCTLPADPQAKGPTLFTATARVAASVPAPDTRRPS